MKIKILSTTPKTWYVSAIGEIFDAECWIHPTFKYKEYILTDTEHNRKYFEGDELSLMILRDRMMGVNFNHADVVFEPDFLHSDF
ncbi:hypothetical protein [Priestia aryabhattai]|uniref:hypothetical protein n=1 Tax=Priestia aryabhattai TaxID=412384 RepID=UPI0015F5B326|nr:hypothetical protein [Priestia aryabhattai]